MTVSEALAQSHVLIRELERRAHSGDPRAQRTLASRYYEGWNGVAADATMAMYWYHAAANQGLSQAMDNIAHSYVRGFRDVGGRDIHTLPAVEESDVINGLTRAISLERAAYWFAQSARQQSPSGTSSLAYRYRRGEGVIVNEEVAAQLWVHAARLGDVIAAYNAATCTIIISVYSHTHIHMQTQQLGMQQE